MSYIKIGKINVYLIEKSGAYNTTVERTKARNTIYIIYILGGTNSYCGFSGGYIYTLYAFWKVKRRWFWRHLERQLHEWHNRVYISCSIYSENTCLILNILTLCSFSVVIRNPWRSAKTSGTSYYICLYYIHKFIMLEYMKIYKIILLFLIK